MCNILSCFDENGLRNYDIIYISTRYHFKYNQIGSIFYLSHECSLVCVGVLEKASLSTNAVVRGCCWFVSHGLGQPALGLGSQGTSWWVGDCNFNILGRQKCYLTEGLQRNGPVIIKVNLTHLIGRDAQRVGNRNILYSI